MLPECHARSVWLGAPMRTDIVDTVHPTHRIPLLRLTRLTKLRCLTQWRGRPCPQAAPSTHPLFRSRTLCPPQTSS